MLYQLALKEGSPATGLASVWLATGWKDLTDNRLALIVLSIL
jgi:hypothetical protein